MIKKAAWASLLLLSCATQPEKSLGYQGVVEFEERQLSFEVSGRLLQVAVREGESVEAGQLLAWLDDSLERAQRAVRARELQVAEHQVQAVAAPARAHEIEALRARGRAARAAERQLRDNLERERALLEGGATPRALVDDLERQLERAAAQRQELEHQLALLRQGARFEELETARARVEVSAAGLSAIEQRLTRYELRALHAGEVTQVYARAGEMLPAGAAVLAIADTRQPHADVFVPQGELAPFTPGRPVQVRTDSLDEPLPGRVAFAGSRTEFTPRFLFSEQERPNLVVRVRVRIDAPERQLHAGVPVFVDVLSRSSTLESESAGDAAPQR